MSRSRVVAAVVPALAAGLLLTAAAAPAPSIWAKWPTGPERQAAFAAAGVKPDSHGRAAAACKVRADGGLEACRLVIDSSAGGGFGKALLALAPIYRVNLAAPRAPKPGEALTISEDDFHYDTAPNWLRKPTSEDLLAVYPTKALAEGRGGAATIDCMVSVQGALYGCAVMSESPAGEHFGDAAVALAPQFLMKPATLAGKPVVSSVGVPIKFVVPPGRRPELLAPTKGLIAAAMAWPEAPSYAAVAAAYPAKARAAKLGGRATLNCEFARDGRLRNCDTITEEPKGEGFGSAAKVLARQFRAVPTLSDGKSIAGAGIQLPVVFDPAMLAAGTPVIGKAQWAGLPGADETSAAFGKLKVDGAARVRLACVVQEGGSVTDCKVEQEDPAGQGVGAAALSLAPHFKLTTWTAEGLPTVGGTIQIPIRYELKADAPLAAAPKG